MYKSYFWGFMFKMTFMWVPDSQAPNFGSQATKRESDGGRQTNLSLFSRRHSIRNANATERDNNHTHPRMALLSDDEDGFASSSRRQIRRAGRPTNTTLFSSELPSFDSRSDPNDSYNAPKRAGGGRSAVDANTIDVDDEELYAEGEETKVRTLMRRWLDERLAPDLLPWQGELVAEILEMLQSQVGPAGACRPWFDGFDMHPKERDRGAVAGECQHHRRGALCGHVGADGGREDQVRPEELSEMSASKGVHCYMPDIVV
jgi:hypothetical protein